VEVNQLCVLAAHHNNELVEVFGECCHDLLRVSLVMARHHIIETTQGVDHRLLLKLTEVCVKVLEQIIEDRIAPVAKRSGFAESEERSRSIVGLQALKLFGLRDVVACRPKKNVQLVELKLVRFSNQIIEHGDNLAH
jgi:hypothetical protein